MTIHLLIERRIDTIGSLKDLIIGILIVTGQLGVATYSEVLLVPSLIPRTSNHIAHLGLCFAICYIDLRCFRLREKRRYYYVFDSLVEQIGIDALN